MNVVAKCLACESAFLPSLISFWTYQSVASIFVWTFVGCSLCMLFQCCCIWLCGPPLNSCTCFCSHRHQCLQFFSCMLGVQSLGMLTRQWISWTSFKENLSKVGEHVGKTQTRYADWSCLWIFWWLNGWVRQEIGASNGETECSPFHRRSKCQRHMKHCWKGLGLQRQNCHKQQSSVIHLLNLHELMPKTLDQKKIAPCLRWRHKKANSNCSILNKVILNHQQQLWWTQNVCSVMHWFPFFFH